MNWSSELWSNVVQRRLSENCFAQDGHAQECCASAAGQPQTSVFHAVAGSSQQGSNSALIQAIPHRSYNRYIPPASSRGNAHWHTPPQKRYIGYQ
jgi:hypothetical protein